MYIKGTHGREGRLSFGLFGQRVLQFNVCRHDRVSLSMQTEPVATWEVELLLVGMCMGHGNDSV